MAVYKVVEKFISINGEGTLAGQLAVFIRFKGCNLQCDFCDTKWANKEDAPFVSMTEKEIYNYIKETNVKNVTLTGGEPLLQKNIKDLLLILANDNNLHIEIETNGSIALDDFISIKNRPSFTMDYKLSCSKMEHFMNINNFKLLDKSDTVKFVVGSKSDLDRCRECINKYNLTKICNVYISPVFEVIEPAFIVDYMKEYCMNDVNFQIQIHKVIWNPNARGV